MHLPRVIYFPLPVLFFVLFPFSLEGQDLFVSAKAKVKDVSGGFSRIAFVKIRTENGDNDVFIGNLSTVNIGPEVWEVYSDTGGKVEFNTSEGKWGYARMGQIDIEMDTVRNKSNGGPEWMLFSRKDTVYISSWEAAGENETRLNARMFRRYNQLFLPTGEAFEINLVLFRYDKPGKLAIGISEPGKISDFPGEFRILATLILMRALLARLKPGK
ncbi:MAG: hypothetical protein R3C61_26220 [Bacteroidia bacterium]